VRAFRFPVSWIVTGREAEAVAIAPRPTPAVWWRPTPRGRVRHLVIALPGLGLGRR